MPNKIDGRRESNSLVTPFTDGGREFARLGQREGIDALWHFSHGNARNLF
jgi:hypothetical protein